MKKQILLFLLVCSMIAVQAQDNRYKDLDSLFGFYDRNELFSVNAFIKRGRTVLYEGSAGYQNREKGIKNDAESIFLIGSITKTYTAVIVMQLVEEDRIRLDDRLARFYPGIPGSDKISIEMLLRHRSGLFNYTSDSLFLTEVKQPVTEEQLLEKFSRLKMNFEPDRKFEYSNTNYMLLGFIIEKVTNDTYAGQLEKRITGRLGLKSTFYGRPADRTHFASSYVISEGGWLPALPEWDISWAGAAGGIAASAADVALFMEGLFGGALLSEKSLELMKEQKEGYGLGLITVPYGERRFYGHTGGIESYESIAGFNAADSTVLVRLVNAGRRVPANDISIQLLNAAYGREVIFPDIAKKTAAAVPAALLKTYEGTYAAPGFPLEIRLFVQNDGLYGQATGQAAFPLTSYSDVDFGFDPAKIEITFFEREGKKAFHFRQGPARIDFSRKE